MPKRAVGTGAFVLKPYSTKKGGMGYYLELYSLPKTKTLALYIVQCVSKH